jgi:hypothetical protein
MVVKNTRDKVSLVALHPSIGEDHVIDFLGKNKMTEGRLWAMRFFCCYHVMESWVRRSIFPGSPNASCCSTWLIGGSSPN